MKKKRLSRENKEKGRKTKRKTLSASERFLKKLLNVGLKISAGAISRPMSTIEFSIQSMNEICIISIRKSLIGIIL